MIRQVLRFKAIRVLIVAFILLVIGIALAFYVIVPVKQSLTCNGSVMLKPYTKVVLNPPREWIEEYNWIHPDRNVKSNITLYVSRNVEINVSIENETHIVNLASNKPYTLYFNGLRTISVELLGNESIVLNYTYTSTGYIRQNLWLSIPAALLTLAGVVLGFKSLIMLLTEAYGLEELEE